jgi:hypothetical protein
MLLEQNQAWAMKEAGTSSDKNQSYGYIIQIRYSKDGVILMGFILNQGRRSYERP